jgi:hypothetical protein
VGDRANNKLTIVDQSLRIAILRSGFGGLSSLVFVREIREIRN